MVVQAHGTHYFVTPETKQALRLLALGDQTDEMIATAVTGRPFDRLSDWMIVEAAVHRLITEVVSRLPPKDLRAAAGITEEFAFEGDEARLHVVNLLHAYGLVTGQIQLKPVARSLAEKVHNRQALGQPWAYLLCDDCSICYSLRPRSWCARTFGAAHDSMTILARSGVERCSGTLRKLTVRVRSAELILDRAATLDLKPYPGI